MNDTTYAPPPTTEWAAPTAPAATPTKNVDIDKVLLFGGMAAVLLGIFLPIFSFAGESASMISQGWFDPLVLIVGLAAIGAGVYGIEQLKKGWIILVTGIIAVANSIYFFGQFDAFNDMMDGLNEIAGMFGGSAGSPSLGIGMFMLALGGVALIVAWHRGRRNA